MHISCVINPSSFASLFVHIEACAGKNRQYLEKNELSASWGISMHNLKQFVGLASAALVLSSCGVDNAKQAKVPAPVAAPQTFSQPTVPASNSRLLPIPIQGIIQVTNGQTRVAQVSTSTDRDPFAAIPPSEIMVSPKLATQISAKNAPRLAVSQSRSTAKSAAVTPNLPTASIVRTKPVTISQTSVLPAPAPIAVLPTLPSNSPPVPISALQGAAPPALTQLADTVAITGVLQVGGKLTAIVQEPDSSPRYVQSGDYLANGQVLLKRIVMSQHGQPTIILQENGKEVTKTVGA
jgi:hypothetical protein